LLKLPFKKLGEERRGFPCSRSQASGKDKEGFNPRHNYLKHQIHHVFAQVHVLLPSPQSNVGFTGNSFKINIDGRKIKKSANISTNVTEVVDTLFLQFMAFYGKAPPERGSFFKLQVFLVYEGVGKSVIVV